MWVLGSEFRSSVNEKERSIPAPRYGGGENIDVWESPEGT